MAHGKGERSGILAWALPLCGAWHSRVGMKRVSPRSQVESSMATECVQQQVESSMATRAAWLHEQVESSMAGVSRGKLAHGAEQVAQEPPRQERAATGPLSTLDTSD